MSNETQSGTRPSDLVAAAQPMAGANGAWLNGVRARGAEAVANMAMPDRRQEAWRYTPVRFLDETRYRSVDIKAFDALQLSDIDELLLAEGSTTRLVFVNGHLAPNLCAGLDVDNQVLIRSLGGALGEVTEPLQTHLDALAEKRHVFAALNAALMSDGALIHVKGKAQDAKPIELLHISVGMDEPLICHPRHLVVVEPAAQATLIERYATLGEGVYFNNALVEVSVGDDARFEHLRVQDESANAQHLTDLHVKLGARAHYKMANASLGGSWSRTDVKLVFDGEDADAQLDGLMLGRDKQLTDVHLDVQHLKPGCTSRETFRGVLDGKGRVVFDGRILVAKDAQLTDAALSNDNLMLSRSAEVDTKPQLEIYADDVKCSHGTTVGELDSDMLFYLRSRGIAENRAKQMLCQGFAAEVVDQISQPELRDRVLDLLAKRLSETG